jgi:hypothetical protein
MKVTFCPENHVLLGLQIGYVALFLPLAFYGIFLGYKLLDSGLDRFERRLYPAGLWFFLCGIVLAIGCASALPRAGYWLADCRAAAFSWSF